MLDPEGRVPLPTVRGAAQDTAAGGNGRSTPSSPGVTKRAKAGGGGGAFSELAGGSDMERYNKAHVEHAKGYVSAEEQEARRPPPARPHSLQDYALIAFNILCGVVVYLELSAADPAHVELFFIYYQPLLPMVAMLWLWGVAVRYFERARVKYDVCFNARDQKYLLNSRNIIQVANLLTTVILTSAAAFAWHCASGQEGWAALHPPFVYCALAALALLPAGVLFKDTRLFFSSTLWRISTPFREVTWADFLLADVLTSLAKALSDAERAVCHLVAGGGWRGVLEPHATDDVCGSASWIIPLGLSLPYAWRLMQCIRVYMDTGQRPQVFNAIKYSTAFPVIILSSMKYQVPQAEWAGFYKPLWLAAACLNSGYSYFWDIERDWDISWFTNTTGEKWLGVIPKPRLAADLLYPPAFYYYLMASNLALRLSWTYKLSPHLRRNLATVMVYCLLEVFRRFQWMFVRIEVELRKLQAQRPELGRLVPPSPPSTPKGELP